MQIDNQLVRNNRGLKIRLYPTSEQETLILKTFGCCRKIYNEPLQERVEFYVNNILPIKSKTTKVEQAKVWKTFKPTTEKRIQRSISLYERSLCSSITTIKNKL